MTVIAVSLLLACQAQSQELPFVEEQPRSVELKGSWFDEARGKIVLEEDEKAESVKKVLLQMDYQGEGWFTRVTGEGSLAGEETNFEVYTERDLGESVRTFAAWKREAGVGTLSTGVEGSLFGADQIRITRLLRPQQPEPDATEISLKLKLAQRNVLRLQGVHTELGSELGGEVHREMGPGLGVGASFTTRRDQAAEGPFDWSFPRMEGQLRWTW